MCPAYRHFPQGRSKTGKEDSSLTDTVFWDRFWAQLPIPQQPDFRNVFDRSLARILQKHLEKSPGSRLVEVGCAPGRWLVYCHRLFGYQVAGYESSPLGVQKTRENLDFFEIEAELIERDFTTSDLPTNSYDVVLSLGFIEHFSDPNPVMERHARILRPEGKLILEVPNLRGLNHFLISRTKPEFLQHHNLSVMAPHALGRLGIAAGLVPIEVGYMGGMDYALFPFPSSPSVWRLAIAALSRVRMKAPSLDRVNASWLSGYVYAVFRKPG